MSKTVRKRRYIDGWRIGENESWFSDMAEQGLHLKSLGAMFARFERGEPERMRYRIDFTCRTPETEGEQRALYAENGWEYVCEQNDMRVFRSPESSNAPELHTDPAEQAYTLGKLNRRFTAFAVLTVLLYACAVCMMCFALFFDSTPTLMFVEGSMLNLPLLFLLYILGSVFSIEAAVSVRALIRSLREGREINHRADWRRRWRFSKAVLAVIVVFGIFAVSLPFYQIARRHSETLPLGNNNPTLIRLADVENDPALIRKNGPPIREVEWLNSVTYEWSPYAPVMLEVLEQGIIPGRIWADGSGEYSPSIDCKIYTLRFAWMADGLMKDLCRKYEDYGMSPILDETGRQGFDKLYIRDEEFWREVFASKGSTVIRLRYYGEKDMQSVIDAVMELLNRG